MTFYFVIFSLAIVFYGLIYNKHTQIRHKRMLYLFLVWLLLFILFTFRDVTVGADTVTYRDFFYDFGNNAFGTGLLDEGFEVGFNLLNVFVYHVSNDFLLLNAVVGCFLATVSCVCFQRYVHANIWAGVFVFLTLSIFFNTFNVVRQSIAVYICWLSIPFIFQRKLLCFLSVVFLAICFHKTALIFVPMYWAISFSLTKYRLFMALFVGFLLGKLIHPLMTVITLLLNANNYIDSTSSGGGYTKFGFLLVSLLFVFKVVTGLKDLKTIENRFFLNMLFFAVFLQSIAIHFTILTRLTDYFTISLCVLFPQLLVPKLWKNNIIAIRCLFIVFFLLYFYLSTRHDPSQILNYRFI